MQVNMTVNGEQVTADVEPRMLLVHFLRDQLRLTGTHWGCDTSNCGTCVVDVDGVPVKSCTMLAVMASGHSVRTVEGLAVNGQLDPVQEGLLLGVHHQTRDTYPKDTAELLPKTQGEASTYIKSRIKGHFRGRKRRPTSSANMKYAPAHNEL